MILAFYSSACPLCASLRDFIQQKAEELDGRVSLVRINADYDEQWAPEILAYQARCSATI